MGLLVFSLFLLIFFPRVVYFVDAGRAAVLFRRFFGGVVTTQVYGEGVHLCFPWDHYTEYNVRIQEESMNFIVLSQNGLSVSIDISVRYHPDYDTLGLLHKRVGPDYAKKVILPIIEGSVRDTAGRYGAEDFYATQGPMLQEIENHVRADLAEFFIFLDGLTIKGIRLPDVIQTAIEEKEEQRERLLSYEYRLRTEKEEAIRKQIEALGWANFNRMVGRSLSQPLLQWRGIDATLRLASSPNSKVVVVGNNGDSMPVILGSDYTAAGPASRLPDEAPAIPPGTERFLNMENRIGEMRDAFNDLVRRNRVETDADDDGDMDNNPTTPVTSEAGTTSPPVTSPRSER